MVSFLSSIYIREDSLKWAVSVSYVGKDPALKGGNNGDGDDDRLVTDLKKGLPPETMVQVLEAPAPAQALQDRPGKPVAPWVLQQLQSAPQEGFTIPGKMDGGPMMYV